MKRFKFDPDKYKNFAEYFDLAANKSEPHKAFKFVQILQRNTKHFKKATTFVLSAIVFGAGLFILPGGKIGVQRDLKTQTVKIGTEIIDSFADLTQSYSTKLYLNRLLLTAFLFLDQNEIFTPDIGKTQLNKLTVAVIDYADKDYEIVLSTLNYLSIFIPKLIQKEPDFFLDEEVQNSLLNLVDILVEKTNLTRVQRLLKDEKSLVDQNLYTYEVVNYQSIVQSLLVILRYSKNDNNKALCYKLFNKFATKDYSELITAEDVFCTIDGIQIVLSDLSSKNKEVQSAALVTTCLLFKNDDQAIKLLKTRILSNLIQNLKDPSYQLYLKKILEAIKDNRKKNLLLTHSELFKVEKERLTQLSQDKTVDQQIRELLKSFLKTS